MLTHFTQKREAEIRDVKGEKHQMLFIHTVYVPIDAHCASADLRVRVYLKKKLFYFFC